MVEAAVAKIVKRLIYLSTIHVYKNPMEGKIDETTPTTNLHPYAISKLAGEKVVQYASKKGEINSLNMYLLINFNSDYSIIKSTINTISLTFILPSEFISDNSN